MGKKVLKNYKFALLSIIFLFLVFITANNSKLSNLLGNINSYNNTENKLVDTGVIIDSNKLYSSNNLIDFKIYNGSNKNITITDAIVKNNYCKSNEEPCSFTVLNIDDINVNSNNSATYQFNNVNLYNSLLNRIGVRYKIEGDNNVYDEYYYAVNNQLLLIDNVLLNTSKKEELKEVYDDSITKLDVISSKVDEDSYLDYLVSIINAREILKSGGETYFKTISFNDDVVETNITDEEIQTIIDELNNKSIKNNQGANYIEYNNLINEISSNEPAIYDGECYTNFINLYNEKDNYKNLSNVYQNMIDNYVNSLSDSYHELLSFINNDGYSVINNTKNAKNTPSAPDEDLSNQAALGYLITDDYHPFDGALSLEEYKELILNLDKQIYTSSSQNKIDIIIDSLTDPENEKYEYIYGFKRNEQEVFDGVLLHFHDIVYGDYLEKEPGEYEALCEYYDTALNLDLNIYVNPEVLQEVIWNIDWDLKADEQDKIDDKVQDIIDALNELEKKPADYESFNEIYEILIALDENNYVDFSNVVEALNEAEEAKGKKIDEQDIVDLAEEKMRTAYDELELKPADYSRLNEVVSKLPNDTSKYPTNLKNEIDNYIEEVKNLPKDLKIPDQGIIDALVTKGEELLAKLPPDISNDTNNSNVDNSGNTSKPENKKIVISKVIDSDVISYIKVNGKDVDISKKTFKITVDSSINSATIEVGLKKKGYTYEVRGGSVLLPGENIINIYVKDKNGNVKDYVLTIIKESGNNYLESLIVNKKPIKLIKNKKEYDIKIKSNINKLDIEYKTMDKNAIVKIYGNKNLKNGSKVVIKVTSTDNSTREYILNIKKNNPYVPMYISLLIILIVIISIMIIIYMNKKKSKNIIKGVKNEEK